MIFLVKLNNLMWFSYYVCVFICLLFRTASPLTLRNEGLSDRRPSSPATSVATDNSE
jgi:hypothetical protein